VIAARGPLHISRLVNAVEDPVSDLPAAARAILAVLIEEVRSLDRRITVLDREIGRYARDNAVARRLMTNRSGDSCRTGGSRPTARGISARSRLRGLARIDSASAVERRQTAAGTNLQDG
jgi:hypothetical protein